ncbi:MAG: SEC-C domain-containing protein, partial [Clostridia bacterium]|nr:SEC-C domain-containing protein [Clostridia bacterium]
MIVDEYDEPWAVQAELEDPETLLERLRLPFLAKLPYPDLNADDLVRAGGEVGLPGDVKSYFPLLDLLRAHEAEEQLAEAVMLIENELVDEAINTLTEACGLTSLRDIEQLTEVVTDLSNAMPRWYNKGYSPDEMVSLLPGGKKASMPGRNSPCPCGSGRKYKLCCGRRVQ